MAISEDHTLSGRLLYFVRGMSPTNFAAVMSTGIVSISLHLFDIPEGAWLLFVINLVLFVVLVLGHLLRVIAFPTGVEEEFFSHGKGPGFLSIVAGTCILGNQMILLGHLPAWGMALLWLGILLWLVFMWGIFYGIFTQSGKPSLEYGINGAWLLATVSTQSMVILGLLSTPYSTWDQETAYFLCAALFVLGFMLYLFIIIIIFLRLCFFELTASELSPTFWINAGAAAITTLAGAELILNADKSPLLLSLLPFLKGLTLMAWTTASWWLPFLVMLGVWRHRVHRYPLSYSPEYWGLVFPLGTYTACTFLFAKAMNLLLLDAISRIFIVLAVLSWMGTFVCMCRNTWHLLRPERTRH